MMDVEHARRMNHVYTFHMKEYKSSERKKKNENRPENGKSI